MKRKEILSHRIFFSAFAVIVACAVFLPSSAFATQLHTNSEGITTHQIGHTFFLFSMLTLIYTITGKKLGNQKGWRLIRYSAFLFIIWNFDALLTHFLDNQIFAVKIENFTSGNMRIATDSNSDLLSWSYFFLKLDHLLCVPALFLFYRGISSLLNEKINSQPEEQNQ